MTEAFSMNDNLDPMDDLTKRRIAAEVQQLDNLCLDVAEVVQEASRNEGFDQITAHMISIGLREDALDKGLWMPLSQMLSNLAVRMTRAGIDRDGASQVLYGAWRGREHIPELEVMEWETAQQTRRHLDWALDEVVPLCAIRDQAPQLAWFAMSLAIDMLGRLGGTGLPSKT
jgi:hypothetical protein